MKAYTRDNLLTVFEFILKQNKNQPEGSIFL